MKKITISLIGLLLTLQHISCVTDEGCDTPEVYSVTNAPIVLYPYYDEDTVRFLKNNADTLVYKRGALISNWTYLPTNPTVCPKKYETLSFTYSNDKDSNNIIISHTAFIGDGARCYYANEYIGPYSKYYGSNDSIVINNVIYKNLTIYYEHYNGDTTNYVLRSGRKVVKIKCKDNILTIL